MDLQEMQFTLRTLIAWTKDLRSKQRSSLNLVEGTSDDTALKLAMIAKKGFVMLVTQLKEAEIIMSMLSLLLTSEKLEDPERLIEIIRQDLFDSTQACPLPSTSALVKDENSSLDLAAPGSSHNVQEKSSADSLHQEADPHHEKADFFVIHLIPDDEDIELADMFANQASDKFFRMATVVHKLALALLKKGKYQEAIQQCQIGLKSQPAQPNNDNVARIWNTISMVHSSNKNYDDAINALNNTLKHRKKPFTDDSIAVAVTLNNLTVLYAKRKTFLDGEPLCQRSLRIKKKHFGSESLPVVKQLYNMAALYHNQMKYEKADEYYQVTLKLLKDPFKSVDPMICQIKYNLDACNRMREIFDQPSLFKETTTVNDEAYTLVTLISDDENIELKYMFATPKSDEIHKEALDKIAKGNYDDAVRSCKENLGQIQKAGPNAVLMERVQNTLSLVYSSNKDYYSAIQALCNVLASREKRLGYYHHAVAVTLNNLAVLYAKQGNYMDGEQSCQRSLKIKRKHFGSQSLAVAKQLYNMAALYQNQKKYGDADQYYKKTLELLRVSFGPIHPLQWQITYNLDTCNRNREKIEQAAALHEETATRHKKAYTLVDLIPDDEDIELEDMFAPSEFYSPNQAESNLLRTPGVVHESALDMITKGNHQEAIQYCDRALFKMKKYSQNSAYVERVLNTKSLVYSSNKNYDDAIKELHVVLASREKRLGKAGKLRGWNNIL